MEVFTNAKLTKLLPFCRGDVFASHKSSGTHARRSLCPPSSARTPQRAHIGLCERQGGRNSQMYLLHRVLLVRATIHVLHYLYLFMHFGREAATSNIELVARKLLNKNF